MPVLWGGQFGERIRINSGKLKQPFLVFGIILVENYERLNFDLVFGLLWHV